jgi:hypothetical protein
MNKDINSIIYCIIKMNYYTIPKNNTDISLKIQYTSDELTPYLSHSMFFYLNNVKEQLNKIKDQDQHHISNNPVHIDEDNVNNKDNDNNDSIDEDKVNNATITIDDIHGSSDCIDIDNSNSDTSDSDIPKEEITVEYINKIVNPFEFIHTIVPGSNIAVSKVKPDSNLFFELMELFQIFDINELLQKNQINIGHFTPNHSSSNYYLNMLREDNTDNIIAEPFNYDDIYDKMIQGQLNQGYDLLIFEFNDDDYENINNYIKNMLLVFSVLVNYQNNEGLCIIKIDSVFYKIILDIIFSLSYLYDKLFVIKPMISDITKGYRYLICKNFNIGETNRKQLCDQVEQTIINKLLSNPITNYRYIYSILSSDIPYFLINKINEMNMVIGQQQIEAYDQIINIFKNKNRDDKLEALKRNHIQKCIHWCEKNQLPHNKFIDKINIFLTSSKKYVPS